MRVEAVGNSAASSARQVGMEMWRMSMTQRLMMDMRHRINGQTPERLEPRKVEPAVRIEISKQARRLSGS